MKRDEEEEKDLSCKDSKKGILIVLSALFLIIESAFLFLLKELFLFVHLFFVIGLSLLIFYWYKQEEDCRMPLLTLIALLFLGPLGMLGTLIMFSYHTICSFFPTTFDEWYKALFPEITVTKPVQIYERIRAGWDDYVKERAIIPFYDLFKVGNLTQKQVILELIVQNFTPNLAPLLKEALNDSSNAIRVQSAAIVSKIDNDFENKKRKLNKKIAKEKATNKDLLALARLLDDYAFTQLLDPTREEENQEKAMATYTLYLQKEPNDEKAYLALGSLLSRMGLYDKVILWFEEKKEKQSPKAYGWYSEALFMLKEYTKLQETAKAMAQNPELPKEIDGCIKLWAR